jgi:sporulation integral membrane protein YtvI
VNVHYVHVMLRFLIVLVILTGSIYLFFFLAQLVYPFVIALALAYMMNPLVNFLERRARLPRGLAVFLSLILLIASCGGILTFLVIEIISGTQYLSTIVPDYFRNTVTFIEDYLTRHVLPIYEQLNLRFNELNPSNQNTIIHNIQNFGERIIDSSTKILSSILLSLSVFISNLPTTIAALVFSLLATFFISKDWDKLRNLLYRMLPRKFHRYGGPVIRELKKAFLGFMKAQLMLITMTTVIVLIGLTILQVPYAITVSLIIGFVDLLPYLGTGFILVPWITYSFVTGDISFAIALLILYTIVLIQRQIMEPKVLSSNIGLDPLATLIALFVGFNLFGFLGLIIGPVILVIIKTLHSVHIFEDLWKFIIKK